MSTRLKVVKYSLYATVEVSSSNAMPYAENKFLSEILHIDVLCGSRILPMDVLQIITASAEVDVIHL
ncbi:3976_t:CDS:2 [Funneliformis mosseae]|uniref:3976_t:CDS:1 n=1 Tax=Funneliformis mosseae TaxID=27381 RepID=A0A9N9EPY9_FUNMO|nr:3976_t:CDS:2 [Funneliformis mosseae]